jgi:hypothetical protein
LAELPPEADAVADAVAELPPGALAIAAEALAEVPPGGGVALTLEGWFTIVTPEPLVLTATTEEPFTLVTTEFCCISTTGTDTSEAGAESLGA